MNLIACDQNCRHQEDGYCTLNQISALSSDTGRNCGYYTQRIQAPYRVHPPEEGSGIGLDQRDRL